MSRVGKPSSRCPQHDAARRQAKQAEFFATIERRIQAIRDATAGCTRSLSERESLALAGEWYRWFVDQHEDNPGSPERWEDLGERLAELMDRAHSVVVNKDDPDDDSKIQIDAKEWADSRHWITQDSGADRFLADRGLVLTPEAHDRFLYRVAWEFIGAWQLLKRRAQGDYSPDKRLEQFPDSVHRLADLAGRAEGHC